MEPPFQFAYVLAEQCDTVVTGAHPLFHCFKTVNRIASRLPRQIQSLQHVTVNLELSVSDLSDGWQRYGPGFPQVLPLSHTESVSPVQQLSFTATRRLVGCGLTQQRPIARVTGQLAFLALVTGLDPQRGPCLLYPAEVIHSDLCTFCKCVTW